MGVVGAPESIEFNFRKLLPVTEPGACIPSKYAVWAAKPAISKDGAVLKELKAVLVLLLPMKFAAVIAAPFT